MIEREIHIPRPHTCAQTRTQTNTDIHSLTRVNTTALWRNEGNLQHSWNALFAKRLELSQHLRNALCHRESGFAHHNAVQKHIERLLAGLSEPNVSDTKLVQQVGQVAASSAKTK